MKTVCTSIAALMMLAMPSFACENPNDQRDKWLAGWVEWIPAKGKTAETEGKTFSQAEAIKRANTLIPQTYAERGADVRESKVGMAALTLINMKVKERKARKSFDKTNGKGAYDKAASCWERFM